MEYIVKLFLDLLMKLAITFSWMIQYECILFAVLGIMESRLHELN